ncbi:MAG: STAS domain-containing protein [Bacteriovoracaceae bacterium]|nr:STAS domain-containing protein [Bacteriovoracaceae bacterium]
MSMKANVMRDSWGNIVVNIEGHINYDNTISLRQELISLSKNHPTSKLKIDLSGMNFVGSSGLGHFVETLKLLQERNVHQLSLANVSEDFGRIFKLYGFEAEGILIDQFDQDQTPGQDLNKKFGNRKFTFEQ